MYFEPAETIECCDPSVLLKSIFIGCSFNESNWIKAGGLAGLGFKLTIKLSGVEAHLHRSFRERTKAGHEPCGMPGGAGCQLVALNKYDIGPTGFSQVIGHRTADHPATDYDHLSPAG
jgi:hypothetical protein